VDAGFLVHGNPICAGFGECRDEIVGIFDHQVAIEWNFRDRLAKRGDDRRTDGEIRNEMPIHYVKMENRTTAVESGEGFGAELREVGGKNGRCKLDQLGRSPILIIRGSGSETAANVGAIL
jgi:hypothetical protein